jgi:Zn/Cd-binding protein ZinT
LHTRIVKNQGEFMPYLFAHFREKLTVDGEQVYFAVSKNGYDYTAVNSGKPVITCDKGEKGCRDIDIIRLKDNSFVIIATERFQTRRRN